MFKELNILRFFFELPNKDFNVREIARLAKITPATSSRQLKILHNKGLLTYRKERILDFYRVNTASDEYRDLKSYYNIRKLKESGLINALNKHYIKPAIILYGSASKGLDTEQSDFDMVVVSEKTTITPGLKGYERKLNRRIHIFAVRDIKDLKNPHLINNVLNGIIIQGEIKWN